MRRIKYLPQILRGPCRTPVFSGLGSHGATSGSSPNYQTIVNVQATVDILAGDTVIMEVYVAENFQSSIFSNPTDTQGNVWSIGFQHFYTTTAGGVSTFGAFFCRVKNGIKAGDTLTITIPFINAGTIAGVGVFGLAGFVNLGKTSMIASGGFDNTGNAIHGGSGTLSFFQIVFGFANIFDEDESAIPVGMTAFPNMFAHGGALNTAYALTSVSGAPLAWDNTWMHSGASREGAGFIVFNYCQ